MAAPATSHHTAGPVDHLIRSEGEDDLAAPVAVRMFEIERRIEDVHLVRGLGAAPYRSLLAVVCSGGRPLGVATFSVGDTGCVSRERLVQGFSRRFGIDPIELRDARVANGFGDRYPETGAAGRGVGLHVTPWTPRLVSVVIATCGKREPLARCIHSVLRSDYRRFEIVVADNRPHSSDAAQALASWFPGERRIRYVQEAQRGASRARNAGLAHAAGDVVAFIDDDVVVHPNWLGASVGALTLSGEVACCTGLILPLELESESQLLLEQFAAFGKGFRRKTVRLRDSRADDPLLPYTVGTIGSGANMVMRADVARQVGGFDTALGPGTPAAGAEDLELLIRILRANYSITYEPSAMVWHQHPHGMARLRRQAHRYGIGLGAMLAKQVLAGPDRRDLLRAIPAGLRYLHDPSSRKNRDKPEGFPRHLVWLERAGMLFGPLAYVLSTFRQVTRRERPCEPR